MLATIWGCRGSLATPGPDTVRYGGNTSCVHVENDGAPTIILDAGTGIRTLGMDERVRAATEIHLLLTHLHLDHLEGLGFFGPLWNPAVELHIWGPASPSETLGQRIARYLSPPLFPVHLEDVPSTLVFHDAPDGTFRLGSVECASQPIAHSGPAVGYRLAAGDGTLAYLPDHEPTHGTAVTALEPEWISGYDLARDAGVLLHDSQYSEEEYPEKIGWGHSSIEHVVDFARVTGAQQLVLFHHDPLHDDDFLERHLARGRELWGDEGRPPLLAHEGMRLDLRSRAVVVS